MFNLGPSPRVWDIIALVGYQIQNDKFLVKIVVVFISASDFLKTIEKYLVLLQALFSIINAIHMQN